MNAWGRTFNPRDVRLLERALIAARITAQPPPIQRWRSPKDFVTQRMGRGAKTTTRKRMKDLSQGVIEAEPLPELNEENLSQQAQYPSVLQGVRENVVKFPNCVVITRVGNFYEVQILQYQNSWETDRVICSSISTMPKNSLLFSTSN